jgi:hypothetical protein
MARFFIIDSLFLSNQFLGNKMMSNKKFIQYSYSVQQFSTYFNLYTKVLTVIGIALFILKGVMWRAGGFFNDMFFPYVRIILLVITLTVIVVVPYTLWILIKEKKRGWIIGLVLAVVIPLGFVLLLFKAQMFYNHSLSLPVLFYTVFCYLLNSEVKDWLNEYYSHENRLEQKRIKEERIKNGLFD